MSPRSRVGSCGSARSSVNCRSLKSSPVKCSTKSMAPATELPSRPPARTIDAADARAAAMSRVVNETPTGLRVRLQPAVWAWHAVHSTNSPDRVASPGHDDHDPRRSRPTRSAKQAGQWNTTWPRRRVDAIIGMTPSSVTHTRTLSTRGHAELLSVLVSPPPPVGRRRSR